MKNCTMGLCAWLCGSIAASASVVAYDGYDTGASADAANGIYQAGADLYGTANKTVQGGNIIGFGTSDWVGSTGLIDAYGTGLTSSGIDYSTGGSVRYAGYNDTQVRAVRRSLNSYTGSSTYYVSMLVNSSILETTGSVYGGINSGTDAYVAPGTVGYGIYFGFAGNGSGMDLVVRQRENLGGGVFGLANTVLMAATANTTYHLVAKIEVNANSSEEAVTVWVNPTDSSSSAAANLTSYSMQNETSISVMSISAQQFRGGVSFDEMRLGTTWSDVAVPEPATLGLLGAGVFLATMIRKRFSL